MSDAQLGYPVLLAESLDADCQLDAFSGGGMIRDNSGTNRDTALAFVYPYTLPDVGPDAKKVGYLNAS